MLSLLCSWCSWCSWCFVMFRFMAAICPHISRLVAVALLAASVSPSSRYAAQYSTYFTECLLIPDSAIRKILRIPRQVALSFFSVASLHAVLHHWVASAPTALFSQRHDLAEQAPQTRLCGSCVGSRACLGRVHHQPDRSRCENQKIIQACTVLPCPYAAHVA